MFMQAFMPLAATNSNLANSAAITIAATNTSVALPNGVQQSATQVEVVNNSSGMVFVNFGTTVANSAAVIPTNGSPANGYPIGPGVDKIISIPPQAGFIGVIGAAAGGTLYVTQGEGV